MSGVGVSLAIFGAAVCILYGAIYLGEPLCNADMVTIKSPSVVYGRTRSCTVKALGNLTVIVFPIVG